MKFDIFIFFHRSDNDALIKIIRLLANLMTVEKIGIDFIANRMVYYKDILKKIKVFFSTKDIDVHNVKLIYKLKREYIQTYS